MAAAAPVGGVQETEQEESEEENYLPVKPTEPLPTDCCGTGCTPCVMDIYYDDLKRWTLLKEMNKEEREKWWKEKTCHNTATSTNSIVLDVYKKLLLSNISQVTNDSFLYTFKLPEDSQCLGLQPGQHLIMRLMNSNGEYVSRQYTPVSPFLQKGSFNVLIKLYSNGEMSHLIKNQLQIGSKVEWRGPFGQFNNYQPNKYSELVMLACGTGIAPMIQVIRSILGDERDDTMLILLYAIRNQNDVLMKTNLDEFNDYWNFKVIYYLSQSSAESIIKDKGFLIYNNTVKFGRINLTELQTELRSGARERYFLICGTKSFEKDMIKYILQLEYTHEQIYKF